MIGFERGTKNMAHADHMRAAVERLRLPKTNTEYARELAVLARSQPLMTVESDREMSAMLAGAVAALADELDLLNAKLEHYAQRGYVGAAPFEREASGIVEVPHASAGCDHEYVNGKCFFCRARPR